MQNKCLFLWPGIGFISQKDTWWFYLLYPSLLMLSRNNVDNLDRSAVEDGQIDFFKIFILLEQHHIGVRNKLMSSEEMILVAERIIILLLFCK